MRRRVTGVLATAALITVSLAAPGAAAVINGTSGPDVLVGTAKADSMHGFGGADKIFGKAGADQLYAGRDNKRDYLYGGPGNDVIHARLGDTVYAGRGNDVIWIGTAAWHMARIYCGPGFDHVYGYNPWVVAKYGCEKVN